MAERRTVTKATCERYRKATKQEKGVMLGEFVVLTCYTRCYARWLLRNHGRRVEIRPGVILEGDARARRRRGVQRTYGEEVVAPVLPENLSGH